MGTFCAVPIQKVLSADSSRFAENWCRIGNEYSDAIAIIKAHCRKSIEDAGRIIRKAHHLKSHPSEKL
jgi:hypothetical protein